MGKRGRISIAVEEAPEVLKVRLTVDGVERYALRQTNPKPVRVRLPLPKAETLIKMSTVWAVKDGRRTPKGELKFYIQCREKGIAEELAEIRKSIKRIAKQLEAIDIANSVMPKLSDRDG